jgi:hypothetical protein
MIEWQAEGKTASADSGGLHSTESLRARKSRCNDAVTQAVAKKLLRVVLARGVPR